tara:strand:- start:86 stop:1423 length:1338 start_codon:yes stop_codon:yes gene_type:complete
MSDIGLTGIPTAALKRDASGEINPSIVDGSQSIEFGRQFVKSVTNSNTSQAFNDVLTASQIIRGSGEKLSYPMETGNPAYQARVSFRMFSLQPKQDGSSQKSHLSESPIDNTKKANPAQYFDDTYGAAQSVGPTTTSSGIADNLFTGGLDDANVSRTQQPTTLSGKTDQLINLGKAKLDEIAKMNAVKAATSSISGGFTFQPVKSSPIVDMYFPLSFAYVDTAQYENASLGALGAAATGFAEAGAGVLESTLQSFKTGATSTFDAFLGNKQLSEGAARIAAARAIDVSGAIFSQGIRNALTLQNRTIINPNIRALFRGVALREFTFQFKMIAESAQEAATIQNIIKHFRSEMYPDTYNLPIGSTGTSADLGYKFPNVFQISFNYKNSQNKKLPKLQYCYLRNVSHTINPTGGTFKRDGQPNEIDLTLSFIEYKTLNKQDVRDRGF